MSKPIGNDVHWFIAVSLRRKAASMIEVPYVLDDDALSFLHSFSPPPVPRVKRKNKEKRRNKEQGTRKDDIDVIGERQE